MGGTTSVLGRTPCVVLPDETVEPNTEVVPVGPNSTPSYRLEEVVSTVPLLPPFVQRVYLCIGWRGRKKGKVGTTVVSLSLNIDSLFSCGSFYTIVLEGKMKPLVL